MKKWKPYLFWIGISEAVGALAAFLARDGIQAFSDTVIQPPLTPPMWVFPVVWTALYALMGISAARIYRKRAEKGSNLGLNLFVAQLILNFFWTLIFFNAMAYGFAFLWLLALWGVVLWMILVFSKVDLPAALLQLPYLIWLTFAAYLNLGVWLLNR